MKSIWRRSVVGIGEELRAGGGELENWNCCTMGLQ
jgi:hypothetical protein